MVAAPLSPDPASLPAISSILRVVRHATGLGLVVVAQIDEASWTPVLIDGDAQAGIRIRQSVPLETTTCFGVKQGRRTIAINDTAHDQKQPPDQFLQHHALRSCVSAPIILGDGSFYGTLCAFDSAPAVLNTPRTLAMFGLFASLIADQIDGDHRLSEGVAELQAATVQRDVSERSRIAAEDRLAASSADLRTTASRLASSEAALLDAETSADLRDQFVAILGHDLRNPLAAISAATSLLLRTELDDRGKNIVRMMQGSVSRMAELVRHMLDLARARMGGGALVNIKSAAHLEPHLRQAIDELSLAHPTRTLDAVLTLNRPVDCDPERIAQLLSNLIGNALSHGATGTPVRVAAHSSGDVFTLSVANAGEQIPPATMTHLFKPFVRGSTGESQGLGLGLHIAAEIAHAHGGELTVTSTPDETEFVLRMPVSQVDQSEGEMNHVLVGE